jgi:hypothetical protein
MQRLLFDRAFQFVGFSPRSPGCLSWIQGATVFADGFQLSWQFLTSSSRLRRPAFCRRGWGRWLMANMVWWPSRAAAGTHREEYEEEPPVSLIEMNTPTWRSSSIIYGLRGWVRILHGRSVRPVPHWPSWSCRSS